MEGISGIVDSNHTSRNSPEYEKGRKLMVGDVNAAIEGLVESGGAEVFVSDAHGGMNNIHPEDLHEAAVLVRGSPKPLTQMAGISKDFDAAFFIGYHSKKGTMNGILSHTISGRVIDSVTINGVEVGETGINAAIAGYHDVPVILVSGDLSVNVEAKEIIPDIVTVQVKKAISRQAAHCLSPKKSRELIKQGVKESLKKIGTIGPFAFKSPIQIDAKYANAVMADAVGFMPSSVRIDGRTVRFVQDDYLKAFGALRASIYIAGAVS
jgi:D-amino peptidase